jgi:aminopeptidase N
VQLVAGSLRELFWRQLPLAVRQREGAGLEQVLREGLERSPAAALKATFLNALRSIFTTPAATAFFEQLWRRVETIPGLPLSEADETALALELAMRSEADVVLEEQLDRLRDDERHARFQFVMPAASADEGRRAEFFFPRNWTDAVLGGHSSPHAAAIVRDFLAARPELPPRLRNIILQAADGLFRAAARSAR